MRQQLSTGQMHTRPTYAQTSLATTLTAQQQQQQQQRAEKSLGFFPSWKTLALASLAGRSAGSVAGNLDDDPNAYYLPQPRLLLNGNAGSSQELDNDSDSDNNNSNSMDIDLSVNAYGSNGNNATRLIATMGGNEDNHDVIDTIENEVARAHDLLDLELSGHGFRRSPSAAAATSMSQKHLGGSSIGSGNNLYASMPAGIRSAIVASAAIVLTSLATLLVIFVVCRWRQHRRRKTSYLKTYNAMKSKLPQLAQTANASRRNSLREHMEELVIGSSNSNSNCNSNSSITNNNSSNNNKSSNNNSCHKPISVATVSCNTPVHHHHHHQHQLQRQSSLLFNREGSTCSSQLAAATSTAASVAATTATATATAKSGAGGRGGGHSLALTLRTAHQKLNTMDPNSPEVQEYLFDTLRKSFDN